MTDNSAFRKSGLLRRYNRLLTRYSTHRHELSLAQIADTLACTARYARTLLHQMQEEGWLVWSSRPGRGALGVLQCRMNTAALQTLLAGEYPTPDAQKTPGQVEQLYSADGYRYIISFYRPLLAPVPSIHTDRAGRHILQMVHAGLTRHIPECIEPQPGLAHTITVSEDGLEWRFVLRRGLVWHNGELVQPEQLLGTLQRYTGGPGLPHVLSVTLKGHTIIMHLKQPDSMLPYRLANPVYALAHPQTGTVGLGPFRLSDHSNTRLVLTRSPTWYGETPQAAEIVYNTPLSSAPMPAVVRMDTPRSLLASESVTTSDSADAFYFLSFNHTRGGLSEDQQAVIRQITQSLSMILQTRSEDMVPLPDWLEPPEDTPKQALLPVTLNLIYFRSTDMKLLVDELVKSLRYRGCKVNLTAVSVTHWLLQDKSWEEQDICLGFMRFGQYDAFTLEERFRHSVMLPWFWGQQNWLRGIKILDRVDAGRVSLYRQRILRLMYFLIARRKIVPLFAQRYRLIAAPCIRGIHCYSQGWPDYTRVWTDEEEEAKLSTFTSE